VTAVVAWVALLLAAGHILYVVYLRLREWELERQETLELRNQALNALAGVDSGWRDERCARCGHKEQHHFKREGCLACQPERRCVGFVAREVR
jgi:hypothetical protein